MNILYSILYAALTVILALAPFGVLFWLKRSKKKVEFWQLILAYIASLTLFGYAYGYMILRGDIHDVVFYLYELYAIFLIVSPFWFRRIFSNPNTIQGAIVLVIALLILGFLTNLILFI